MHTTKPVETCPYCEGHKVIRKGKRKNKYGDIQLYYCHHCRRRFSPLVNKNRTYPLRVIIEALSLYNHHNSYQQTADFIAKKFGIKISRQIVRLWVSDYEEYLLFKSLRERAAKIMEPYRWISETRLLHGLVYSYKYHRAKAELIVRGSKRYKDFEQLQDYLEGVPLSCPHTLFREQRPRASTQRHCFQLDGVKITPRHENTAVQYARFVLQTVANNKRRHETVQDFLLVNDSATIAVEVPVILRAEDLKWFAEQGYDIPLTLDPDGLMTGHIDIVQIRFGMIHILDYKPGARREKPIEQLMIYALALSRLTGIDLYHFKCAWFDDQDYFEFYPRAVVKKTRTVAA
ncbi:MAG: PD-(D/E)XK nuclease family protein [Candidatus Thiodiazotropha lotti]|nr:PD-(D/E)XK nuclease family protein [Candidatus Thiodiazotropha lotti]